MNRYLENIIKIVTIVVVLQGVSMGLLNAQAPAIQWQRPLGGPADDYGLSVDKTFDGGYITAGMVTSRNGQVSGFNGGLYDYWVVKLSATGATQWSKCLGGTGFDQAFSIIQVKDSGYVVAGKSRSTDGYITNNYGDFDVWVVKLDKLGNVQWQKNYGTQNYDCAYSIQQTIDGGYIIAGETSTNGASFQYYVVKTDGSGNAQWQKTYGGFGLDYANCIKQTPDKGYIIVGASASPPSMDVTVNHGDYDYWIVKTDSVGVIQWQKSYGGTYAELGQWVTLTADGGYIVTGSSSSSDGNVTGHHSSASMGVKADVWVVKLTATGTIEWQKSYGGTDHDLGYCIIQANDGSYVIASKSYSIDGDLSGFYRSADVWILNIDQTGTMVWQKRYGGGLSDESTSIHQTADGGFVFAGVAASNDGDVIGNNGNSDFWVVKLGPAPCQPTVTITASATTICQGTAVVLNASVNNGGTAPVYQWLVNGNPVGSNSNTFTTTALVNGDVVICKLTSNASCAATPLVVSNSIAITVNSAIAPAITISTPSTTVCAGSNVTFTATAQNGGSNPGFQWQINGSNAGANSTGFSTTSINNGDIISCLFTSSLQCATPQTLLANSITMQVLPLVSPSVNISTASTSLCAGSSAVFTATAVNGGIAPVFQWKVNATNVGLDNNIFSSSALNNGDIVSCTIVSNAQCVTNASANSNAITMDVQVPQTPAISITSSATTAICTGSIVAFNATATAAGTSPIFQWQVNGVNVGTNSNIFSSAVFTNGDVVKCILTSSQSCVTTTTATSNSIVVNVLATVIPSISISTTVQGVCEGEPVTFQASTTDAGTNPRFAWKVNGVTIASSTAKAFTSSTLRSGDSIQCILIPASVACPGSDSLRSNTLPAGLFPVPLISVVPADTLIRLGDSIQLKVTTSAASIHYKWTPVAYLNRDTVSSPVASPKQTTTYSVQVTTQQGCVATKNIIIKVMANINIPNVFSPNGDGINDYWALNGLDFYPNCRVYIYTRYGQLIYSAYGYHQPWDGSCKGKQLPIGTYYYVIDLNGKMNPLAGHVSILK